MENSNYKIDNMKKIENIIGVKNKEWDKTIPSSNYYQTFEKDGVTFCVMEINEFNEFNKKAKDTIFNVMEKNKLLEEKNSKLQKDFDKYNTLKLIMKDLCNQE